MRVIKATQQMLETRTLVIGFQGENLRTQLRIDCVATFAEYPNATPALAIKPPSGATYPVFVERDGTEVVWDIIANNLILKGDGELQLTFYKDNVIAKTSIGHITVNRSLQIDGEMPDVVATWIENANRKLAEVDAQIVELEGMVDTATDAATRAEQSASTASTKAEQAATSAATASAKAAEAQASANTATAKAAESALSATQASNSAMSAANSESGATAKAAEAAQSAQTAAQKAEQITEAAQIATGKAEEASASATAAQTSASNAASSATAAQASQTAARASETAAGASATQAAQSAQNANTAAQTATQKAAEATQSASNAATSATSAATSAETASTKAGEAAQSAQAVAETAEQLAESLEQISQNTADIAEHKQEYNALKEATLIHNTASGAIASFPDGAEMPVDEVTAQINPVQDLHGYDAPWPAGGGKNLFYHEGNISATVNGLTATFDGDTQTISITGTNTGMSAYVLLSISCTGDIPRETPLARAILNAPSGTYINFAYRKNGVWRGANNGNVIPADTDEGAAINIQLGIYSSATTINITGLHVQIERGTTAPTEWTPYSNICPISGFDGLTVTRTGKNLFNKEKLVHGRTTATLRYGAYGQDEYNSNTPNRDCFLFAGNYTFSLNGANSTVAEMLAIYDETGTRLKLVYNNKIMSFTVPVDGYVRIIFTISTPNFVSWDNYDIQLERGSTATAYEPYQGETYEVEFPSEAGTVYGGSLTIAEDGSGVLTVDRAMLTYDGDETFGEYAIGSDNYCMVSYPQNKAIGYQKSICDSLPNVDSAFSKTDYGIYGDHPNLINTYFRMPNPNVNTRAEFLEWLSENPIHLVYELATPITYTLTASQITTLLGENNLWHDANGDISVGYKANTKLYIDGKIAELVARIVNS